MMAALLLKLCGARYAIRESATILSELLEHIETTHWYRFAIFRRELCA